MSTCLSDEDYVEWRAVRMAVVPYERTQSVAELREGDSPERLLLLARVDGVVAGSGLSDRAESANSGSVIPRVLPEFRRQGIGTALLHRLADHVAGLGFPTLRPPSTTRPPCCFAEHFGFAEVNREVEQTYTVSTAPDLSPLPEGIEVVTAGERPGLWEACFDRFGRESLGGLRRRHAAGGHPRPVDTRLARRAHVPGPPRRGGRRVRRLGLDADDPTRAENALTAVRRDWRGRGIAVHLKQRTLAWAAERGIAEVYTWTQDGNAAMRALNARLGYATTRTGIQMARTCRSTDRPFPTGPPTTSVVGVRPPPRARP